MSALIEMETKLKDTALSYGHALPMNKGRTACKHVLPVPGQSTWSAERMPEFCVVVSHIYIFC